MAATTIGVSLKTYFGHQQAQKWMASVATRITAHPGVISGRVRVFVIPTYLQIPATVCAFRTTPVLIGAQDVSEHEPGAYTGEVTAAELTEVGVQVVEIGHAERRRLFGETDATTAAKAAISLRHGLTPVLCLGETEPGDPSTAAATTVAQLRSGLAAAPPGPVIVAYEPVWAIGAPQPAPVQHITTVTLAVRAALAADPQRPESAVIYGGSAGPGLLSQLGTRVDGLFLGRFAHNVDDFESILTEAAGAR
ncbi:MAG: triose-phosphate isomerase family protein [Propioniciclava sp.]